MIQHATDSKVLFKTIYSIPPMCAKLLSSSPFFPFGLPSYFSSILKWGRLGGRGLAGVPFCLISFFYEYDSRRASIWRQNRITSRKNQPSMPTELVRSNQIICCEKSLFFPGHKLHAKWFPFPLFESRKCSWTSSYVLRFSSASNFFSVFWQKFERETIMHEKL